MPTTDLAFDTLPLLTLAEMADMGAAIEHRRQDTVRTCTYCSDRALFSYVTAIPLDPPRWMDVCGKHSLYLRGQGPL
jgi:hypothetical protein